MNGCQLAGLMAWAAPMMNNSTTATFTNTITLLTFADSLMPMTRRVVTIAMMITAGRLRVAGSVQPVATTPCAAASEQGMVIPISLRKLTTYPDQPIATVT